MPGAVAEPGHPSVDIENHGPRPGPAVTDPADVPEQRLIVGLTAVALATAVVSGMAGMGGGMILIGVLYAIGMSPALALPLHAGVQLASNASRGVVYREGIQWSALALFLIGAVSVPFVVTPWVARADPDLLRLVMGVFIALGVWPAWARRLRLHGPTGLVAAGAIAGCLGPLVGGVGVLVAPFFLRARWTRAQVIATMAVGQAAAHAAKILAFSMAGYDVLARADLLLPMMAASIVGAIIGRRLNHHVPERIFRRLVRLILLALAIKLAGDGLYGLIG